MLDSAVMVASSLTNKTKHLFFSLFFISHSDLSLLILLAVVQAWMMGVAGVGLGVMTMAVMIDLVLLREDPPTTGSEQDSRRQGKP